MKIGLFMAPQWAPNASIASAPNRAQPARSSQRRRGKRRREKDRSNNQFLLAPTPASADRYVVDLIDPINPRPTRAATFYEALPPWTDFLVRQSLISESEGRSLRGR